MAQRQSLLPLLLPMLVLICRGATADQPAGVGLCDGEEFRSIMLDVYQPSCLSKVAPASQASDPGNCSLMRRFEQLAKTEGKSLDYIIGRSTVLVLAHSEFIKEVTVPNNPVLDMESELARHYAFVGVTRCLKKVDSTCQRLRKACGLNQFVFMASGHCSKSFGCQPIHSSDDAKPTALLNMMPYLQFRLIERQAFVARDRGELQLSLSATAEYLIQTELNETYGSQLLLPDARPVAVFVAGPAKTLAYYQQLVFFLDAAISLRDVFAFHVIAAPLSRLDQESERPTYRWRISSHESFLALYTSQVCSSSPTWAFSCKPSIALGSDLLFAEQYVSFLLYGAIKDGAPAAGAPYPAPRVPSNYLSAFVRQSTSYTLAVLPVEEMLTDRMMRWDGFKSLVTYLQSSFGVTYHPLILTKATAIESLQGLNTGLNLEQAFYRPSFFIRLANGAFAVLKIDEPIAVLDRTVRDASAEGSFQVALQSMREMFKDPQVAELPASMINAGHLLGGPITGEEDIKDLVHQVRVENRTDAFVEQMNFKEVYNVTGVLVVDTDAELMRDFFDRLGQDKPWLVLFTVTWSPLCKAARAVWASAGDCARRMGFPEVQLVKVDCFEANEICNRLKIAIYPTIAMFSRGIQLSTYSGPIMLNDLCLYVKLAFQPPVMSTSSPNDTRQLVDQLLAVKARAFVYRGAELPDGLAAAAKMLRFREAFVHEKSAKSAQPQLTAVYGDVSPNESVYRGSLDDKAGALEFIETGHLDSLFPCTWNYLPQALKLDRPLVLLFHHDAKDAAPLALLDGLRAKVGDRPGGVTYCHLNLRRFVHLNDLVRQLAGLSLPALVTLTRSPSGGKVTHRLPLGAVPPAELASRSADWLSRALGHQLADARPVEPRTPWQPASKAFNFVDQVYRGKAADPQDAAGSDGRSSRSFTLDGEDMRGTEAAEKPPPSQGEEDDDVDDFIKPGNTMEEAPAAAAGGGMRGHGPKSLRDEL